MHDKRSTRRILRDIEAAAIANRDTVERAFERGIAYARANPVAPTVPSIRHLFFQMTAAEREEMKNLIVDLQSQIERGLTASEMSMAKDGTIITAIKAVRQRIAGIGLKEAKDMVDAYLARSH